MRQIALGKRRAESSSHTTVYVTENPSCLQRPPPVALRVMAKKKHKKDPGKKQKASRSAQGKQRQERRDGWTTRRRQVTATPYVSPHCYQGPRGRSAARLQEDEAQAAGAPPAAG
ncbi:hypothetical protein HaLaN_10979 [Haematococcus lacustris]|uniref:Uncharacterized protein n=1 Tax=Haematococcus lacustris TaxID=44745 RepID=A0A699YX77_HAELA|nr:hypothetical protein HaLaN_10979 [Haematococcus lacustris]